MSNLFKKYTFVELDVTTREEKPTLWVFGCSHSFGVGLLTNEKTYGSLLSEKVNMPLKLVAKPGSSTQFSLRHLVNADIRENDIVIWQLATAGRFSYATAVGKIREIIISNRTEEKFIKFFTDPQLHFHQLSLLNIGVNYLMAKKVKFVVTSINNPFDEYLIDEYRKYTEYCFTSIPVDKGNDHLHAGPITHQNICNSLYNHIQYLYD